MNREILKKPWNETPLEFEKAPQGHEENGYAICNCDGWGIAWTNDEETASAITSSVNAMAPGGPVSKLIEAVDLQWGFLKQKGLSLSWEETEKIRAAVDLLKLEMSE